jgi:nucleotide-binding universal stress UspA family protein
MHILVGVDGSDRGFEALAAAVESAREQDADLTVAAYSTTEQTAETVEREVRERLADDRFDATVERIDGDPGGQLVELAETGGYDRILLPGGTRSPLGKIQFDSAVEFVLLNVHTSVTLVR